MKKLYREDLGRARVRDVAVQALYDAADDDSATGGPDLTRRIFPVVHVVTADGGRKLPDDEIAEHRRPGGRRPDERVPTARSPRSTCPERRRPDEHAVLRLARAADEGPGRLRPQGHRPRTLAGGGPVRRRRAPRDREPVQGSPQGLRDLRPDRVRRGRPLQRVREPTDRRCPARGHARLLLRPSRRDRSRSRQCLCADARHHLLQRWRETVRGRDLRGPGRRQSAEEDEVYRLTYEGRVADEHGYAVMGGDAETVSSYLAEHYVEGSTAR